MIIATKKVINRARRRASVCKWSAEVERIIFILRTLNTNETLFDRVTYVGSFSSFVLRDEKLPAAIFG